MERDYGSDDENNFNREQRFSFASQEFVERIKACLGEENYLSEVENIFNDLPSFENESLNINEFFEFLKKLILNEGPIPKKKSGDNLAENQSENNQTQPNTEPGKLFLKFIQIFKQIKIQNSKLKNIIRISLINFFKKSNNMQFKNIQIPLLDVILTLGSMKTLNWRLLDSLVENTNKKIKDTKDFPVSQLINLLTENSKKFDTIYFFSKLLECQNSNLDENNKNLIEKTVFTYIENDLLDDSEMDLNLQKLRLIVPALRNINQINLIYSILFPSLESLLLRTIRNYKFLEVVFTNLSTHYNEEFINSLFKTFKDYFFSQDKLIVESATNSFLKIVQNSNRKILLNNLLSTEFSADKVEQNLNVCNYLVILLNHNNKKTFNDAFNNKELLETIMYCIKKLELQNENNKIKLENIFEILISALHQNVVQEKITIQENLYESINNQIKKLLSNSNYSSFFGYIYMLITILTTKLETKISKNIIELLFNNIKGMNLTISNTKNLLSLISTCFTISATNKDFISNNYKKLLLDALKDCLINFDNYNEKSANVIFANFNFLNLNSFDFINILNVYKQITQNEELTDYFAEEELPKLANLITHLLFRNNKNNSEELTFKNSLSVLGNGPKNFYDNFLNAIFSFVINFFNMGLGNNITNKISFNKIRIFISEYADKFYQQMTNKEFIKFIIISHIPNLNNDVNMDVKKSHKINMNFFLNNIYTKFSKLESNKNLPVLLEENYNLLSNFIFSDLGLLNKNNKIILNACYSLLARMTDLNISLAHPKLSANIARDSFLNMDFNKFKYIDEVVEYYRASLDYISYYDLEYLIENIKSVEKSHQDSLVHKDFTTIKDNSNNNFYPQSNQLNQINAKKNTKQSQTQQKNKNVPNKNVQVEKVDKETKLKEYKDYFNNYLHSLVINENFIFDRLKVNLALYNNSEFQRGNMKNILKYVWKFMSVKAIGRNVQTTIHTFLNNNPISKKLANEISLLMYLQANPKLEINESHPSLIVNFNDKLSSIIQEEKTRQNLFENFDFIIIKLLFFIIMNNNISNDDKVTSVNILIKIIDTLPENILNFNDISMLAVNILKTSYNNENLESLLQIFLTKAKEDHFLMLCEDILQYEYVAKVTFLNQIIKLNFLNLRNYKNLVYKIWILNFDENDNISTMASEIWNKFNLYLDSHFVYSDEFALAFTNHKLKDSINRSVRAYAFLVKSEVKIILNKFQGFYEEEIYIKESEKSSTNNTYEENLRVILFDFVNETIELFSSNMKQELLDFLMRVSDNEKEEEIFELMNKTIYLIIKSINDEDLIRNILSSIEKNLKIISTKEITNINYNNLKIILMMLNSILINTMNLDQLHQDKVLIFDNLYNLSLKLKNSEVLCLISAGYQYLAKDNIEQSKTLRAQILDKILKANNSHINKGEIYILAGFVKCFGISSYTSSGLKTLVLENMKKNKTINEKQNSLTIIKVFSETLKRLYEPYLVDSFDQICELIADREDVVREATTQTIKSFMRELSGYGVKSMMPRLIKDLHSMNWRSKIVNIEILGQFAFCAPKQLSIYIPKVIKEIMQVFKDPHHKVQETAVRVLKDISSVIRNPEIVELSPLLIDAVANPYEHSKNALTALLETDFKHAIDPPSLALIIPIIDYNLKVQGETLKKMSAHLIGSIANLTRNPMDIYHYIDIIIPNLKIALFDSIPECRNAMAKAIGSLTKSLGTNYLQEMLTWVKTYLEKECDTVQRSGAAQAYAEMIVAFGESFIDKHIVQIISKIQESDNISKEGYLSIFVFLPGCLGEKFEKYFELIFPLIIEAFSDDHENVRNVSNKIFEICIKLFAKRNTKQLVDPLLLRLFDENWRIRNSSIALIKTLIMNLNKEFFKETSTFFTKQQRDEILVFTFILKADNSGNTATIANMIWRDYVDNIPKYLSKVIKDIYEQIMVLLSSDKDECFDIAEGCIKMLVTKFSDKFFMELLPIIKETITEKKDNENKVYASFYIFQLAASEASEKLLGGYRERFIRIVNDNIHTPFASVRKLLASIIYEISKKFDDHSTNKTFIYNLMKGARGKVFEEQKNMLEIVGNLVDISKGEVLHNVINEIFRKPYEEGFISLATMISDDIAETINDPTDLKELYQNLFEALNVVPKVTIEAIVSITNRLDDNLLNCFAETLSKLYDKLELTSLSVLNKDLPLYLSQIISKFAENTSQDITLINSKLMEINISLLMFDNELLIKNIGDTIKLLSDKSEKEEVDKFLNAFMEKLNDLENKFNLAGEDCYEKISNKFKFMMDNLLILVQNGLLYAEDKLKACDYVNKIIYYTARPTMKTYIMKMTGPLIRILSDKFSPEIKERVLDNIKNLIVKSKEDIKGISPQLQSVFVKTLTDTSQVNSERCQLKAGENILRLLQYYPRADVIVNDLMKSIINKTEKNEFATTIVELEILSDIIRFYGATLKPAPLLDNFNKILNILNSRVDLPFDYLVTLLSAYTKYQPDAATSHKFIENTIIKEDLQKKLFIFLSIFNGSLEYFTNTKKSAIKIIKALPKDQSVILMKSLGKIINKYKYFIDFDKTNFENLLKEYEKIIQIIILESELLVSSNNILDGNLCVFILSMGYMTEYEENETLFKKIFYFLLSLISQGKVNSQLLVNCLSLVVLKEIKQNPDRESVVSTLESFDVSEKEIEIVDSFLKKIYYLYN